MTKGVPSRDGSARKLRKAVKAICQILSPNRAQALLLPTRAAEGHTEIPTNIDKPIQEQGRRPDQEKTEIRRNPSSYPVRSALRGARPKKATDSSRHVHFATGEATPQNERKHGHMTSPRNYPMRSAMRGSRPKQATDSSRHVHFSVGASGRPRRDA